MLKPLDTHEGAEGPIVGTIAAISGLFSGLATDTQDFSHRLKKRPKPSDPETAPAPPSSTPPADSPTNNSTPKNNHPSEPPLSSHNFNNMAWRMASKTFDDDHARNLHDPPPTKNLSIASMRARLAARRARGGRAHQVVSATAHYACDVTATGAKGEASISDRSCSCSRIRSRSRSRGLKKHHGEEHTVNDRSTDGTSQHP
jgi:sterol 3beta-glucosyltransferase